jgi:hypothetical protein
MLAVHLALTMREVRESLPGKSSDSSSAVPVRPVPDAELASEWAACVARLDDP